MVVSGSTMAQLPRNPDLNAQRAAMQKLAFLVGKWNGEARLLHGPDQDLQQTEEVQYKLDGLLLVIEGVGRKKSDGPTGNPGARDHLLRR
jgi:hypothetical protein